MCSVKILGDTPPKKKGVCVLPPRIFYDMSFPSLYAFLHFALRMPLLLETLHAHRHPLCLPCLLGIRGIVPLI